MGVPVHPATLDSPSEGKFSVNHLCGGTAQLARHPPFQHFGDPVESGIWAVALFREVTLPLIHMEPDVSGGPGLDHFPGKLLVLRRE